MVTAKFLSLLIVLFLLHFTQKTQAKNTHCTPSACGVIRHISDPFRLKGDPNNCGDGRFELECENDVAFLYLGSQKYYVKAINSSMIRVADASITNDTCSFPIYSIYADNLTFSDPYEIAYNDEPTPINFLSCPNPLKNSSLFTYINKDCASYSRYGYIKIGRMNALDLTEMCMVEKMVWTSWKFKDPNNASLSEIHDSLLYGFEFIVYQACPFCPTGRESVAWLLFLLHGLRPILVVIVGLACAVLSPPIMAISGFAAISLLLYLIIPNSTIIVRIAGLIILIPRIIIFPFVLLFLIFKFRRRLLSSYNTIESFLRSDNEFAPIRYSYSDIKKITLNFQDKIGEGGFGSVYKGKLRSGRDVAVKLLGKFESNGQDFMNEIATIGRIHHVNVVKLVGYCAQGPKRALIFDFMLNGSLEKYIFNKEKLISLSWKTKFEIVVGVAQGIKYLHQGCDVQILHFDIKPHNILLDDNFVPKISDFGLAKLCSLEKNTVTVTAARGTIGYVAPELICRSIGTVSYKADVYSFGMLLIDMVGLKRNLIGNNGDTSKYFPYWIYDCFEQGKNIEIERGGENDDNDSTTKLVRKMTLVALWCIQMNPDARPSMNKVLEMLETDIEHLNIPDYPSQFSETTNVDQIGITSSNGSVSLLHQYDVSSSVEITLQN